MLTVDGILFDIDFDCIVVFVVFDVTVLLEYDDAISCRVELLLLLLLLLNCEELDCIC